MSSPATAPSPLGAHSETRDLARWQRKLLPFMSRSLVVLALIFFGLSVYDVYEMRSFVRDETTQSARSKIEELLRVNESGTTPYTGIDLVEKPLLVLEADAMDKRYRQASALLMSRIWTRQLAFMTGMVLTFIGAVFILGKLSESRTDLSLGDERWKTAISSSSPGLILAFFGTILIGTALIVQPKIEVQDHPVYFMTMGVVRQNMNGNQAGATPTVPDPGAINPGLDEPTGRTKK
jgi:hypothetical protein